MPLPVGVSIALVIHSFEGSTIALAIHSLEGSTIALAIHSLDPRWGFQRLVRGAHPTELCEKDTEF